MSNHPHKKLRLIIIKKEQDKSTPDRAKLRLSDRIVWHSLNSIAPLGGAPPPLERSCAVGGRLPPLLACTRFNNKTWQEYQDWLNTNQQTYEQIYQRPLKCIYGAPREISHKKIPPQAKILVIEMNNDENKIMGIGEIINQTASEVYRSPQAVVPLANAHSTSPSAVVPLANTDSTSPSAVVPPLPPPHPTNRAELPSRGGGTPTRKISYKIFSDRNYTRYIYIGNTRYASREELERNHTPDAQYINEQLERLLPQDQQQEQRPTTAATAPHHATPHPSWGGVTPLERLLFKGAGHMKRGSGITRCSFIK